MSDDRKRILAAAAQAVVKASTSGVDKDQIKRWAEAAANFKDLGAKRRTISG